MSAIRFRCFWLRSTHKFPSPLLSANPVTELYSNLIRPLQEKFRKGNLLSGDSSQKQGARNAVRRTGPLYGQGQISNLSLWNRGTARRAPTEVLEQHRPHQIAPALA